MSVTVIDVCGTGVILDSGLLLCIWDQAEVEQEVITILTHLRFIRCFETVEAQNVGRIYQAAGHPASKSCGRIQWIVVQQIES